MRAGPVQAQVIASVTALEDLRPHWDELWWSTPDATPFQSPAWLLPWWTHIGRGALTVLALRSAAAGELVGLAPLYIHTDAAARRHLFPIGMATTDILEPLLKPGWEEQALRCLCSALSELGERWDVLEWPQLRRTTPLLEMAAPAGWRREVIEGEPSPALALPAASATSPLPVPPAMAHNIRTALARAARAGQLAYERAEAASIDTLLDVLGRLHAQRWSERGLPGVLSDGAVVAAHRAAAPALHAAGMLRLFGLRLDGAWIAAVYCLADPAPRQHRRWFAYIGGFEPRFRELSPGTLLIAHAIEQAVHEGAVAFDFLRGGESYKYRWGAIDEPMYTLRVARDPHPAVRGP